MKRRRRRSGAVSTGVCAAQGRTSSQLAHWILDVLLGSRLELTIGSRRFRLTQERAFRLEELDGEFVFLMGSCAALERRLRALAGGNLHGIRAQAPTASNKNTIN